MNEVIKNNEPKHERGVRVMKTRTITLLTLGGLIVLLVTMALAPPAQAAYLDVFNDAKAYWSFDEVGGSIAYDTAGTGNHYNGTLISAPTRTTGIVGGALSFNGINQSVSLPATGNWNVQGNLGFTSNQNWSVSLWYKGTDTAQNDIWGKGLVAWNSLNTFGQLSIRNGYVEYLHYNGGWKSNIKSSTLIADGEWHNIIFINHADGTADLYIDGTQEVDGLSSVISNGAYFQPKEIGSTLGTGFISGAIDEVGIWGKTLSSADVQAINAPNAPNAVPEIPVSLMIPLLGVLGVGLIFLRKNFCKQKIQ